jgi:hypothetical protein
MRAISVLFVAATAVNACESNVMGSNAKAFFEACESGKNWSGTSSYVSSERATFHSEGQKLEDVRTVKAYTQWMARVVQRLGPKAFVTIDAVGIDVARHKVVIAAVFGGRRDFAYSLTFDADTCKIGAMVKTWNDGTPPDPATNVEPVSMRNSGLLLPRLVLCGFLFVAFAILAFDAFASWRKPSLIL